LNVNLERLFDTAIPLQDAINELLRPVIGPFKAVTASVVDNGGHATDPYSTVVHNNGNEAQVPVDSVAAVIDCHEALTVETLEAAYHRVRTAKSIRKADRPDPEGGEIHMTTGIVVARTSALTLEQISSEMSRLNAFVPSHYWPDAVAVLSTGLVNYSAITAGSERGADFFLPAEAIAARSAVPSVWVSKVIRAVGNVAFMKIASLIIARAAIFQPGAKLPDYRDLIKDMPSHAAATGTYQFSLANVLVPMTREQYISSQLPKDKFNIVSGKKTLGSVQYESWQDGGVFVVRGKFPLDLFLIFLNEVVPGLSRYHMQYFRGSDIQVSFVLPVNKRQFMQTLAIFDQRSSNMSIRKEESKILIQKVGDEGSTSPFFARLMIGIFGIRDSVYDDKAGRNHFDELYEPVLSGLRNARETRQDIVKLWEDHRTKVASGAIVTADGRNVHISEHIDRALKRDLESFLNTAVRTIKHSLQVLAKDLGAEIGFLFQQQSAFQAGVAKTRGFDTALADYLLATRQWSEPLVLIRNHLEHGTIPTPKVSYVLEATPVRAEEPQFGGKPIAQFTSDVLDHICCFAEEILVHALRKKLPQSFEITEVPLADRSREAPERFHVTVTPGGRTPWVIAPHARKFGEA
jgi:hypothetical protein